MALQFILMYTHHLRHIQCAFSAHGNVDTDNYNKSRPSAESSACSFISGKHYSKANINCYNCANSFSRGTLSYCHNLHSLMSRSAAHPSLTLKLAWLLINFPLTNIMDIVALLRHGLNAAYFHYRPSTNLL